ncbi:MAG: hypothetical protein HN995_12920 [Candidatus Marinimicrobia bacterium]|jgi:hypothetical protein|nr:hypothetical protein [Candidatus Neomarinimicrobiota bacterium]MBT3950700.1 hypothetical protein [Candidatus Neomarinimicrobiota bacterium]MBT4253308.1 hypothetical protein [Candidatus Neomarinimicrobiota bacterium]MBT5236720.1 hypothetical protein [Candidatus Neomarinimicrobiota bacterium]MBT5787346.1 hypothetical protein [Candidatus Neomarinimicrobiota bacterium]
MTQSQLLMHRGGQECTLDDLRSIPVPPRTSSYVPISHYDYSIKIASIAQDLLPEYKLERSKFGTAHSDQQLFGIHTFRTRSDSLGLSIGFRSSLDKSLSAGLVAGASVLVCDNLCLSSDSQVMRLRKHTTNILEDLELIIVKCILRARSTFHSIEVESEMMQGIPVDDRVAWETLGYLYGRKVISARQMPVALKEWHNPSHVDFEPRNQWSLFNALTESLKTSPPHKIFEKHLALHTHLNPGRN